MSPKVSCILATCNRAAFFQQALRNFSRQSYENRELIVVDDSDEPMEEFCRNADNVRYIRLNQRTATGTKLNIGIEASQGEVIQKFDDDDYYGTEFLSLAVEHLERARQGRVLVAWCCFAILIAGDEDLYFSGHGWHAGGSFCFRRELWEGGRFRAIYRSSDSWFRRDNKPEIVRVCASDQYLVVRHGANTWIRIEGAPSVEEYFRNCRRYSKSVEDVVGAESGDFYRSMMRPMARCHE